MSAIAATPPLHLMTDAATLRAHLIAEDAMIAGRRTGEYRAVCDAVVQAASLAARERSHCKRCVAWRSGVQR